MLEKIRKKMRTLAFRIQLLKAICLIMLGLLAHRLYQMQILYASYYESWLEQSATTRVSMNVPRGIIYDRNLEVLVDNHAVFTINYTFSTAIGTNRMREMAYGIAELLEGVDGGEERLEGMITRLRERDLQDLFISTLSNPDRISPWVLQWLEANPSEISGFLPESITPQDAISRLAGRLNAEEVPLSNNAIANILQRAIRAMVSEWLQANPEEGQILIGEDITLEQAVQNPAVLSDAVFYAIQLRAITGEMLDTLTLRQKASHVIFNAMNQGVNGTVNIVKNNATREEIFAVGEHLNNVDFPGFFIDTSWEREIEDDLGLRYILGQVTSYEQGLPSEQAARLRALGYRNNDRVGRGGLEAVLEPILRGVNTEFDVVTENGITLQNRVLEGQPGMNVSLTIDAQLQARVNEILTHHLVYGRENLRTAVHSYEGYVVLLDPNTGEILSMNGIVLGEVREHEDANGNTVQEWVTHENGQRIIHENALGTIWNAYEMGSTVKGATMLLGYREGVTGIGTTRHDRTLNFRGTPSMGSWRDMGSVNDLRALYESSNVFFWLQTLQMAGGTYVPNDYLQISAEQRYRLFDLHRRFYAEFGLGSDTGIEIPNATGIQHAHTVPGQLLNLNIGQFDTYTTMQLAQYTMTLANGGYRFATQLVGDIFLPSDNEYEMRLHSSFTPRLLNRIDMDQRYFDRIREGFRMGVQGTPFAGHFATGEEAFRGWQNGFPPGVGPAGKTGTAETFLQYRVTNLHEGERAGFMDRREIEVQNVTFVGWAPVENPEVAVAVILPSAQIPGLPQGTPSNLGAQRIANEAMQAFFELRAQD